MPSLRPAVLAAALVSALLASTAVATTAAQRAAPTVAGTLPALGQTGRWLTDPQGRVVTVHGFNIVSKVAPYEPAAAGIDDADATFLQQHGFTAVRLGVIFKGLEPTPGHFDAGYLNSIISTVHLLGRHGIYSLLDFHQDLYNEKFQGEGMPDWMVQDDGLPAEPTVGFPGNYFAMPALWRAYDHFWANDPGPQGKGLQDWYAAAWAHVAEHFRGDTDVLGYDVFNEPFPGTPWAACFPPAGCPELDASMLKPFLAKVVDAIHHVDPQHVAFVEPWVTFDYSAPSGLGKVGSGPTGLSFHPYCLAALNLPVPDKGPVRTLCTTVAEGRTFDNAEAQAKAGHEVPLVSEFGATSDQDELGTIVGMADDHEMGWLNWAYCECGDPTGAGSIESLVYDTRKPPTGSNVNGPNLATLDRGYPMVVAGTPVSYGYDAATRVFTLTFDTREPDGRVLAGRTVVHLPAAAYPHGYSVSALGARVRSKPGSSQLVLDTARGAKRVTVRVTPR